MLIIVKTLGEGNLSAMASEFSRALPLLYPIKGLNSLLLPVRLISCGIEKQRLLLLEKSPTGRCATLRVEQI